MASYWRALCLAGVLSLPVGCFTFVESLSPPSKYIPIDPHIVAAIFSIAAVAVAFSVITTLQAIWYLVRRKKGTAGWLLITAGVTPALNFLFTVVIAFYAILSDPTVQWNDLGDYTGSLAVSALIPTLWIAGGIWLIRLDRQQRLAANNSAPEMGPTESGKWPPLPGSL